MTTLQPAATLSTIPEFPALSDRAAGTYNTKAYNFGAHMGQPGPFVSEINALAANVQNNAKYAQEQAAAAASSAGATSGDVTLTKQYRDEASGFKTAAETSAQNSAASATQSAQKASDSASSAQDAYNSAASAAQSKSDAAASASQSQQYSLDSKAYRDQAQVYATAQLKGTSTTSVTPGAGAKVFTIEANRSFVTGMYLVVTSRGTPSTQMSGSVQSYDATTGQLVLSVDTYSGATAKADWDIGLAAKGATGMAQQVVTGDTVAVPGVIYIFTVATAVLTLPTTGLNNDSKIGLCLAAPVSYAQVVDFGGLQFRGQAAGQRYLDHAGYAEVIQYNATLGGWI